MKRLLVLVFCVAFSVVFCGCQESHVNPNGISKKTGKIPEVMVGAWQTSIGRNKWAFKIERDGSINKVIHLLGGPLDKAEGGIEVEGPDPGTFAVFTLGDCWSSYDEKSGELTVKIVLDYFKMKLPNVEFEGRSDDYFKGLISEDGKIWDTEWRSYTWLEDAEPPDINLINANPEKLAFKKIEIK